MGQVILMTLGEKGARDGDGRKYGYGNAEELRESRASHYQ